MRINNICVVVLQVFAALTPVLAISPADQIRIIQLRAALLELQTKYLETHNKAQTQMDEIRKEIAALGG
ncbi:hypothetical protein BR93DRAFT_923920 [Coniochaeta sp. PMI_546]|nr:hypothetical protein BR93DRAFT_923920 [Coniochaeta sp. PMI_546]